MSTMLYLLIGTISTNIIQNVMNDLAKIFTIPTSPLRNQWFQTFIVCLLVIAVLMVNKYIITCGGDHDKKEDQ
jgi:hypothetical protein